MVNYFASTALLKTPGKRAAYSDRTAYLMAEMSRLAYFKFEGGNNITEILDSVKSLLPDNTNLSAITAILKSSLVPTSPEAGKKLLADILKPHGFDLVETFNDNLTDSQAFLCKHSADKYAVLAFRGTEPNLKDIKADIKANLTSVDIRGTKVEMHSGYLAQFQSIQKEIETSLAAEKLKDSQLFITGHSLGGALAITATKFLANDITGACYTFGSPPVGTKEFVHDVVTPIYRIINYVDIVPRLPNPTVVWLVRALATAVMTVLDMLQFISSIKNSSWYSKLNRWLADAQKYRQSGYGSYLVGHGKNTRLRYNVSSFDKIHWWWLQVRRLRHGDFELLSDHSIEEYSKKLAAWAADRQAKKPKAPPATPTVAAMPGSAK